MRGSLTASKVYDAFGNQVSATGTWKSPFEYAGDFGYQQYADTGFKLLGHRYLDTSTGRFLTRDPIKNGSNWYIYCRNNPVTQLTKMGFKNKQLQILQIDYGMMLLRCWESGSGPAESILQNMQ